MVAFAEPLVTVRVVRVTILSVLAPFLITIVRAIRESGTTEVTSLRRSQMERRQVDRLRRVGKPVVQSSA